ncbi:hypothetical protein RDI58_022291 [Solanum bulbocastanum]|uniref:Uncharacterized protein n=1 Tax=Solanum bulbocastanum TaxID=147425 RepID=A0AAN8T7Q6_SOLBU
MLLKLLKDELLPDDTDLPNSYYEAKNTIQELGLSYNKIDACVNDCMLYWKEDSLLDFYKICSASRWRINTHSGETKNKKGKRIASKSLRYFPLKPRLQRLFMSTKTSTLMIWQKDERVDDGIMRNPADSMAWKSFYELHPSVVVDLRNVRLGLARAKTPYELKADELEQAHIYILKNCDEVLPYLEYVVFKMKPIKTESENSSTMKSTMRYTFVAPGSIGKGRGRAQGLKSLGEKGSMQTKKLFSQSNDLVNHYIQEIEKNKIRGQGPKISTMSASLGMERMHKKSLTLEKENTKINIPSPACTNQVKQYTQEVKTSPGVIGRD